MPDWQGWMWLQDTERYSSCCLLLQVRSMGEPMVCAWLSFQLLHCIASAAACKCNCKTADAIAIVHCPLLSCNLSDWHQQHQPCLFGTPASTALLHFFMLLSPACLSVCCWIWTSKNYYSQQQEQCCSVCYNRVKILQLLTRLEAYWHQHHASSFAALVGRRCVVHDSCSVESAALPACTVYPAKIEREREEKRMRRVALIGSARCASSPFCCGRCFFSSFLSIEREKKEWHCWWFFWSTKATRLCSLEHWVQS